MSNGDAASDKHPEQVRGKRREAEAEVSGEARTASTTQRSAAASKTAAGAVARIPHSPTHRRQKPQQSRAAGAREAGAENTRAHTNTRSSTQMRPTGRHDLPAEAVPVHGSAASSTVSAQTDTPGANGRMSDGAASAESRNQHRHAQLTAYHNRPSIHIELHKKANSAKTSSGSTRSNVEQRAATKQATPSNLIQNPRRRDKHTKGTKTRGNAKATSQTVEYGQTTLTDAAPPNSSNADVNQTQNAGLAATRQRGATPPEASKDRTDASASQTGRETHAFGKGARATALDGQQRNAPTTSVGANNTSAGEERYPAMRVPRLKSGNAARTTTGGLVKRTHIAPANNNRRQNKPKQDPTRLCEQTKPPRRHGLKPP